ncbi:hypothetical protein AOLI_G00030930 [Acnodon oligacanthus]
MLLPPTSPPSSSTYAHANGCSRGAFELKALRMILLNRNQSVPGILLTEAGFGLQLYVQQPALRVEVLNKVSCSASQGFSTMPLEPQRQQEGSGWGGWIYSRAKGLDDGFFWQRIQKKT